MGNDIVLTGGVRANLLQLQRTSDLITSTQTKLATGKRVNTALDNPVNYFTAQGLLNRASDLGNLLDAMGSAFNTIQAANNGITSISKLAQSAQALVSQAQQNSDPTLRANLATQFDQILLQITTLAGDSGFNGINLLDSNNSSDLTVMLNETGSSSVTISAVDFSATGALALNNSANNWGGTRRYCRGQRRADDRPHHAPVPGPGVRLEPVDRADPPGVHQGDDQHAADRLGLAHAGRSQRRGREPPRPADPAAAFDHRPVARLAGEPGRAPPVPVTATASRAAESGSGWRLLRQTPFAF